MVTVTLALTSAAVAIFDQSRPRTPLPLRDCSNVQPVTVSVIVPVVSLVVM